MTALSRMARMSGDERRLLARALVLLATIRAALWVLPARVVHARIESRPAVRGGTFTPDQAAWAIQAVARRIPRTRCLARALALHALLRHGGHASTLQVGVKRSGPEAIEAHAWVSCGGRVVGEAQGDFVSLGTLST